MKIGEFELNKIYCMDCLEGLKKIPDNSVDLVVTSPPFKDEDVPEEYYYWFGKVLLEMLRVSKTVLIFNSSTRLIKICEDFNPERILIWNKKRTEQPYRYEPIFLWTWEEKINKYIWNDCFSYLPILKQKVPYTNPIKLYLEIIRMFKNHNIVLDPFMGSGTTAIACKQLGRNFIGFEINPEYVKIANKRLAQEVLEI